MATSHWNHRVTRRRALQAGGLAGLGLAGAALVGCGDSTGGTPVPGGGASARGSGTSTGASGVLAAPTPEELESMSMEEMQRVLAPSRLQQLEAQVKALAEGPPFGGTLSYARDVPATGWNVLGLGARSAGGVSTDPGTHSSLLTFKFHGDFGPHSDFVVEPDLPQSFEYADDLTLIFRLRDEPVYWHDVAPVNGREFTIDDLVYGVEALKAAPVQGPTYRDVTAIEAPDDKTLILRFSRPAAYFLRSSCTPQHWLVAPEQVESGNIERWAIGTGAFQMSRSETNVGVEYVRNPRYFKVDPIYGTGKRLPFLDGIKGVVLADNAAASAAWTSGQVDYASAANISRLDLVERLRERRDALIHVTPPAPSYQPLIVMNSQTPPFDDVRVRRALSMAIDREAINQGIAGGVGTPGYAQDYTFLDRPDRSLPWTEQELGPYYSYNLPEAKKLLQAAGFDRGLGRPIELGWGTTTTGMNNAVYTAMSDMLRQDLGIDLQVNMAPDGAAYSTKLFAAQYQDLHVATPLSAWDADDFVYGQMHSKSTGNFYKINDRMLDDLAERQQVAMDIDERQDLVRQAMERDLDQMYRLWGIAFYKFTIRNPEVFNLGDHYLAWMTPGWGERKLEMAWKRT